MSGTSSIGPSASSSPGWRSTRRRRGITYQRDALSAGAGSGSGAAAVCDFDRDVPLLRDLGAADESAIEDAIRAGVREIVRSRGEPVATDRAAVAALESLAARKLLAPLTLARAGGVSELETFVDHFRSALADAARSGIVKIDLDGAAAEHAHDTTLYTLTEPIDTTPLDDRLEWGIWGLLSASRDVETRMLLRRAYGLFRDVETPDRELVERCIAAYGHQSDDGRWRLRDEDALVRRQADQTLLVIQLLDAGRRLGFKVHVGRDLERRAAGTAEVVRRRGWRFVKWGPLRSWATRPDVALDLLEPVLGLSPEVEQTGQQLAFRW